MQPGGGDPQHAAFNTYGPPPAKKGSGLKIALIAIGAIGLLAVVVCCGGGYLMFYAGMGVLETKVKNDLGGNAELQKHIGVIQSVEFDLMGTGRHGQEHPEDQNKVQVFNVKGDKGQGVLSVRYSDDQRSVIWARLRTSSGEDVALVGTP